MQNSEVWFLSLDDEYGWERNFVPKKFRGIDSERFLLFRGRKCSFRGILSSAEEPIPKLGTEQNGTEFREKIKFYGTRTARPLWLLWYRTLLLKFWAAEFCVEQVLFRGMVRNGIPTVCFYIFSTERNSELFSLPLKDSEGNCESIILFLYPRKGIPSCFLFRWSVRKGIPRVRFYFCST
jgi:hypothetical protein